MVEPRLRLRNVRNMPWRYRPHDKMRRRQFLEPAALAIVELLVDRCPDEALERFDAFPDRHVDEHIRVVEGPKRGCVVALVLQPPDESRTPFRERIDAIEIVHEPGHTRIIQGVERTADVKLGDVALGHAPTPRLR